MGQADAVNSADRNGVKLLTGVEPVLGAVLGTMVSGDAVIRQDFEPFGRSEVEARHAG